MVECREPCNANQNRPEDQRRKVKENLTQAGPVSPLFPGLGKQPISCSDPPRVWLVSGVPPSQGFETSLNIPSSGEPSAKLAPKSNQ